MYDYYTVEPRNFLPKSVRIVLPTEHLIALYERKVSNVQTKKTQNSLLSLPNESCISRNSLRYKRANLTNCLLETNLGTVGFSIRSKRKTLKLMQHVIIKRQFLITSLQ